MWGQPPGIDVGTAAFGCPAEQSSAEFHHEQQLMADIVKLSTQSELPSANEAKEFPCGDREICVANVNGHFSAMDNICLHRGGPLGQGTIEGGKVVCPWHGWAWDPKTGEATHSASAKVAVYPLKIENGEALIEI
jgi:nitrite reductase (NADH) small subunit